MTLASVRRTLAAGDASSALRDLRTALRTGTWGVHDMLRAGRMLAPLLGASPAPREVLRVHVFAQCTTTWLTHALTALAWRAGTPITVQEGAYDNVMQEALSLSPEPPGGIVLLVPWYRHFLDPPGGPVAARIDQEVEFWRNVWRAVQRHGHYRLVQVGYDWTGYGPAGAFASGAVGGSLHMVESLNARLRELLPRNAYFVDAAHVSGEFGRRRFYDARNYCWTKQPWTEAGLLRLAEHLWAGIRAVTTGPKRVLVLDLDNTLWGGVVGEVGPMDVALGDSPEGEAYRGFQAYLKELSRRGTLLAVASKNNPQDAREPFERNPSMRLTLDDFAAFEASWNPKPAMIERIANTLRLGLDSFVFVDDSPYERDLIRTALPDVEVVDLPNDPAEYAQAIAQGLWFESVTLTAEDALRAASYVAERRREDTRRAFSSLDEYLESLAMVAAAGPICDEDMQRVVQLVGKTNQFNLTTRRHTIEEVRAIVADPQSVHLTVRLRDKFGDYGLVAVVLAVAELGDEARTLRIDTWLMSCRTIGRTLEQFTFRALVAAARAKGYSRLIGEFLPTQKNAQVADLYPRLGFAPHEAGDETHQMFWLDLAGASLPKTFVAPRS